MLCFLPPDCNISRTRSDGTQVCYVIGPTGVTYEAALAFCKSQAMRLAEITTAPQQTFMAALAQVGFWREA